MARILITNNGTHSADKWAVTTAEMIFPLDDSALVGERLIAAQKMQTQLAEILAPHHENVISEEKEHLEDPQRYSHPHHADHHCDNAMDEILEAAKGSPWEDHFEKPEVQEAVRNIIANHMGTAQHVERLWHASNNQSEEGDAYIASFHRR